MDKKEYQRQWIKIRLKKEPNYYSNCYRSLIKKNPKFIESLSNNEKYKEQRKKYAKQNPEIYRIAVKKWKKKNKEKVNSHNLAEKYIKLKDSCELCGGKNKLQRHHIDYKFPLIVKTLCLKCHKKIHRKY